MRAIADQRQPGYHLMQAASRDPEVRRFHLRLAGDPSMNPWHGLLRAKLLHAIDPAAAPAALDDAAACAPNSAPWSESATDLFLLMNRPDAAAAEAARTYEPKLAPRARTWSRHAAGRIWADDRAGFRAALADRLAAADALGVNPHDPIATGRMMALAPDEWVEAVELKKVADAVRGLEPPFGEWWLEVGLALLRHGEADEAAKRFARAEALDPSPANRGCVRMAEAWRAAMAGDAVTARRLAAEAEQIHGPADKANWTWPLLRRRVARALGGGG